MGYHTKHLHFPQQHLKGFSPKNVGKKGGQTSSRKVVKRDVINHPSRVKTVYLYKSPARHTTQQQPFALKFAPTGNLICSNKLYLNCCHSVLRVLFWAAAVKLHVGMCLLILLWDSNSCPIIIHDP